jgi:putative serine/threonine protein kinase
LLETSEVPVRKLLSGNLSRILTYPVIDEQEAKARVRELSSAGVTSLRFSGRTRIDGVSVLGKGCVGVVTHAVLSGVPIALKIRRKDANRASMYHEARLLRLANSVEVGPRLLTATRNFLAMELFDGLPLFRWVEALGPKDQVRVKQVLKRLLMSCFRLDAVGLDHGELSRAPKNVLVSGTGEPCIVDFETASTVRRPANVTSLLQYFMFGKISKRIRSSRVFPEKKVVLKVLSRYKAEMSVQSFESIIDVLSLL